MATEAAICVLLVTVLEVRITTYNTFAVPDVRATAVAGVSVMPKVLPVQLGDAAKVITVSVPSNWLTVPPSSKYKATPDEAPVAIVANEVVVNPVPLKVTVTEVKVW